MVFTKILLNYELISPRDELSVCRISFPWNLGQATVHFSSPFSPSNDFYLSLTAVKLLFHSDALWKLTGDQIRPCTRTQTSESMPRSFEIDRQKQSFSNETHFPTLMVPFFNILLAIIPIRIKEAISIRWRQKSMIVAIPNYKCCLCTCARRSEECNFRSAPNLRWQTTLLQPRRGSAPFPFILT